MVDYAEAVRWGRELITSSDVDVADVRLANILEFIEVVTDCVTPSVVEGTPDIQEKLHALLKLRDDASAIVSADPMVLYKPAHHVAEGFHNSPARIRYFYGGNRISKSQSGIADDYWLLTRQHPWRQVPTSGSVSVALVGVNYKQYRVNVFEKKCLIGEPNNALSPLFPEGGKWLHHYDQRTATIYLACVECANLGRARSCSHPKATFQLFSDEGGFKSFQGAQYNQVHFDEQVKNEFFLEGKQRIKTVKGGSMIVTETPVYGQAWWTYPKLFIEGKKTKPQNWIPELGIPIISLHTIDQFSAGLVPEYEIRADMATCSEAEIRSRIFGEHVAADQRAVFDSKAVDLLASRVSKPLLRGELVFDKEQEGQTIDQIFAATKIDAKLGIAPNPEGRLRIWEPPSADAQYVISADVSEGLADREGDLSAAVVLRMIPFGADLAFKVVASWHGYTSTFKYADELYKLGLYYNSPDLVIENNGPGMAVIQRITDQLDCPFVFVDDASPVGVGGNLASNFGVNTNVKSKAMMISALQSVVRNALTGKPSIEIPYESLINELRIFIQEVSEAGNLRLKAAGSGKDDLVMATAIGVYTAKAYNLYDYSKAAPHVDVSTLEPHEKQFWEDIRKEQEGAEPWGW